MRAHTVRLRPQSSGSVARVFSPSAAGVQPSMKAASWSWPPPLAASMAVAPAAFFWPRSAPCWSRTRQDSRKPAAAARWSAVVPSAAAALTSTPRSRIAAERFGQSWFACSCISTVYLRRWWSERRRRCAQNCANARRSAPFGVGVREVLGRLAVLERRDHAVLRRALAHRVEEHLARAALRLETIAHLLQKWRCLHV